MTIDEAIIHAEQVAELNEAECYECAEEHRQLAKWLKELKGLREERPRGEWISFDVKRDKCSVCDFKIGKYVGVFYNFCPNCGSPMTDKALEILRKREKSGDKK